MIAGHIFTVQPHGRACTHCGRTWINVLDNRDRWVAGAMGIACQGSLIPREVDELEAEIERVWQSVVAGVEA